MLASSSETRLAISVFSLQVEKRTGDTSAYCRRTGTPGGATSDCELGAQLVAEKIWPAAAGGSCRRRRRRSANRQVGSDFVERVRGDPRTVAKPRNQFSVVDDAAFKCRFRCSRFAAKISDLTKDLRVRRARWMMLASFEINLPDSAFRPLPQSSGEPSWCQPQSEWADRVGMSPLLWAAVGPSGGIWNRIKSSLR